MIEDAKNKRKAEAEAIEKAKEDEANAAAAQKKANDLAFKQSIKDLCT